MKTARKIYEVAGVAVAAILTLLAVAGVAAAFASCSGCAPTAVAPAAKVEALPALTPAEAVGASTVKVVVAYADEISMKVGWGSGSVVWKAGKLASVLTAYHVTNHPEAKLVVLAGGIAFPAIVDAIDPENDLALLAIQGDVRVPAIRVASVGPKLYSKVTVAGFPTGRFTISEGFYVGSVKYDGDEEDPMTGRSMSAISGAFLFPGTSGGPVADSTGALVGVANSSTNMSLGKFDLVIPQVGLATAIGPVRLFLTNAGVPL